MSNYKAKIWTEALPNGSISIFNFDLVRFILPASQGTWLHFTNEERWLLQETPEQILELLK